MANSKHILSTIFNVPLLFLNHLLNTKRLHLFLLFFEVWKHLGRGFMIYFTKIKEYLCNQNLSIMTRAKLPIEGRLNPSQVRLICKWNAIKPNISWSVFAYRVWVETKQSIPRQGVQGVGFLRMIVLLNQKLFKIFRTEKV